MRTHSEITVTREELYRRVWERPMRDVAAELGISDVGLKKVCRREGIPTPPQGYHLMTEEAAKRRLHVPLPKATAMQFTELVFRIPDHAVAAAEKQAMLHVREINTKEIQPPTPEQRHAINSVLKTLRGQVNVRQTDRRGMVATPHGGYPIRVSPQSFERAFGFLDTLLTRFSSLGATNLEAVSKYGRATAGFALDGFGFHLDIEETSKRVETPPPPSPKRSRLVPAVTPYWPSSKPEPTGRLALSVWGPARGKNMRTFRDGKLPIEQCLDQLVEWAFLQVAVAKEEARIASERAQRAVAYLQEKDKPQLEAEFQKRRRQKIHREALQWRQAMALRNYIAAVGNAGPASAGSIAPSEFEDWLAWARSYADTLDPISRSEAASIPPYPEPNAYEQIPSIFLDYDDPAEADQALQKQPWRRL